jgi:hypothetical protein
MPIKVHLLHNLTPTEHETLTSLLSPDITLTTGDDPTQADGVELLVGANPTPAWLASSSLRAVIVPWAGVPEKTRDLLREYYPPQSAL